MAVTHASQFRRFHSVRPNKSASGEHPAARADSTRLVTYSPHALDPRIAEARKERQERLKKISPASGQNAQGASVDNAGEMMKQPLGSLSDPGRAEK